MYISATGLILLIMLLTWRQSQWDELTVGLWTLIKVLAVIAAVLFVPLFSWWLFVAHPNVFIPCYFVLGIFGCGYAIWDAKRTEVREKQAAIAAGALAEQSATKQSGR